MPCETLWWPLGTPLKFARRVPLGNELSARGVPRDNFWRQSKKTRSEQTRMDMISTPTAQNQSERFPRLLVVTDFPPGSLVGGALVRQLIRGYPRERLDWWTNSDYWPDSSGLEIRQMYRCVLPRRMRPVLRFVGLKSALVGACWVPYAARNLLRTVAEIQPEQIWVQLSSWVIPVLVRSGLVLTHRCHVSIWDYQNSGVHSKAHGQVWAQRLTRQSEELYRLASTCDAVSRPMKDDLTSRTGRDDAIIVHSGFEPPQLDRLLCWDPPEETEIRIAYAGSILVPEVFRFFVEALDRVRKNLPRPVSLHLFSRSFRAESWFNAEWMHDHGLLAEEEFFSRLQRCTWGFTLMNLRDDDDPAYRRFSFPNKFGTYLSAGLPLIVLAHRDSSAARMFEQYPAGIQSDATDPELLAEFLRQGLAEPHPRKRYREMIQRCAQEEFDATRMRREFWKSLGVR
jgi:hypothetical protein